MKRGLAAATTLLALAILALPWALGVQAERVYDAALARLREQGLRVIDSHYRRGWLSSEGSVRLGLPLVSGGALGAGTVILRVESRIFHGPRDLGTTLLPPPMALVDSRAELILSGLRVLPLLLTTRVELDGGGSSEIRIPAVSHRAEGLNLQTKEGGGQLKFAAGLADVEGRFALPSLSFSTADGLRLGLRALRAWGETSRWIGVLHTGEGVLNLERAELYAAGTSFLATGLSLKGKTVPDGGLLYTGLDSRIEELSVNGTAYGTSRVSLSVSRLPGDALASLWESMRELSAGARDPSLTVVAMAAIFVEHLPLLLAHDPQLTLDPVEIATPEGRVRGRLSLASRGLTRQALEGPGAWLGHLVGEGELSLPRPLLLRWMEGWQRGKLREKMQPQGQGISPQSEGLASEIAADTRERLAVLVRQGWLAEEAGGLRVTAKLADSLLTVNGKTIPVGTVSAP